MNFKARLTQKENGEWHIISYSNRMIPIPILQELNNAVHDVIDKINGKTAWKQSYIRFHHEGKIYQQIDQHEGICEGCCFSGDRIIGCTHPHYADGTKGNCIGKIYKEIKEEQK